MPMNLETSHSGHAHPITKDYDVLRCVHCDKVIQVPHEAFTFKCPHCDGVNEFAMEEENDSDN